jgi:putative ABC transport system permease protein
MGPPFRRLLALFRRNRLERDLEDELAFHLAMREAERRQTGESPEQARSSARRRFGNVGLVKHQLRDAWITPSLSDLAQDLRFGARLLIKHRGFTAAAVIALSLGIGANATVFTLVNAMLIRGLPFDEPARLMAVWTENPNGDRLNVSHEDYEDLREQATSFDSVVATLGTSINVSDDVSVPERVPGIYVSWNLFRMLGIQPLLGRDFREDDDRRSADPVLLLSYNIWQNRYAGASDVLGRTVRVNSRAATVIGVMPRGLEFPDDIEVWIPRAMLPADSFRGRSFRNFRVIGRLASGVSEEQGRAELASIGARLAQEYPDSNRNLKFNLLPYQVAITGDQTRLIFLSFMGAVGFVLLIACANVANLLLARAVGRSREIAIRVAQGAGRWRLVRQLLVESVLLAFVGGMIGLLFAVAGVRWFDRAATTIDRPYWAEFTFDPIVFAFVAGICLVTGVLFGLAPALHVSKTDVNDVLKEGGRGGGGVRARRWAAALIVGELVLTLVLLSGAGFMMRSFLGLYRLDVGFDTANLTVMRLYLPLTRYTLKDLPRVAELQQQFERRLRDVPAIRASALASTPPTIGSIRGTGADPDTQGVAVDGRMPATDEQPPVVSVVEIGDGYFDTIGLPILRGRAFALNDGLPGRGAAIVNQRFGDLHLPGQEPVGHTVRLLAFRDWLTIVGVVANVRQRNLQDLEPDPVVYVPIRSNPRPGIVALLVRAPEPAVKVASLVREELRVLDSDVPVFQVQTMDELLAERRWQYVVFGSMFAVFAAIALILSAVALYSVTAYSVTERTHEIGVRIALGAQPKQILWLMLRRGLVQLAIGLPIGIAGALGVGTLLRSLLFQTSPQDTTTLVSIVLLLVAATLLACIWPARRAARLDPVVALRHE